MCIIGFVYKIIHLDSNICYIGSTCDSISGRWRTHKNGYNRWIGNKDQLRTVSIYPYFEQHGIDRFKMILIKSYEVVDIDHLRAYEQLSINRTKCINRFAALQLVSRTCMSKHYAREYRNRNKLMIASQNKKYLSSNKQKHSEYLKKYSEANKEAIAARRSIKVECECGAILSKSNLPKHKRSQKHLKGISML